MNQFRYERAADAAAATRLAAGARAARYLGGGTNLVDLMREDIEHPDLLVDVSGLARTIEERPDGALVIGAAASNTAVAAHPAVRRRFPVLARAILAGASAQVRNMATVAGNLLQRTRCPYFYDGAARCNKREPGAGCDAVGGLNRMHAILGASPRCVATHPSDMAVALVALDAVVHVRGTDGERRIALAQLHRLPGETPELETTLARGELITAVEIPPQAFAARSTYRKVRDRASFAFALVSVAAALDLDGTTVREARIALGGVAARPWRAHGAEQALRGAPADEARWRAAGELAVEGAVALEHNAFKIELAKRLVASVLAELAAQARESAS